jgi:hypothetical protein
MSGFFCYPRVRGRVPGAPGLDFETWESKKFIGLLDPANDLESVSVCAWT